MTPKRKITAPRKRAIKIVSRAVPSNGVDHQSDVSSSDLTQSERAYRCLRSDIMNGRLVAGQPLRLENLKETYRLSFSPLREALNRLQSERLVVSSALRGFRVHEFSIQEMWDAIDTRILIEGEALKRSIERGHDEWEGAILSALHSLSLLANRVATGNKEYSESQQEELERRHRNFHAALIAACDSPSMTEFSAQLYARTERYRRPLSTVAMGIAFDKRDIRVEHENIAKAALNRDAFNAVELLANHYRSTGKTIESHMQIDDSTKVLAEP